MRIKHIYHLGMKEILGLLRDPYMAALVFYSFSLNIYIASTANPETLSHVPIGIIDEDKTHLSKKIISSFYPPQFVPPFLINTQEMDRGMDHGTYTFTLDIPVDFQKDVLAGNRPTVQLNVDATRLSQAFTGGAYIQSIITQHIRK